MKYLCNIVRRNSCTRNSSVISTRAVRDRFLDYFVNEKQHHFLKSSPILSYFDHSVPFVHSGYCQFKHVFTGEDELECNKAVNSQKCARMINFNNEIYYTSPNLCQHTFFEMLGSWSFGAYSKKDICEMAWKLLTSAPYNVPPERLFVSYFGGDDNLQLSCDEESRDAWLQIGVPTKQISPFGIEHNFWESGSAGPCGPCLKIKAALTDNVLHDKKLGNQKHPALLELWNIAFIKYNRNGNSFTRLPKEFINTGMGLERLTALLQGKTSSYDIDLFTHLFDTISRITKAPAYRNIPDTDALKRSYRSLADLSRLVTVAVADNVFPDLNFMLKRTFRTVFSLITLDFNYQNPTQLLHELCNEIAEEFENIFPEVSNNILQVKLVTENEFRIIRDICDRKEIRWNVIKKKNPELQELSAVKYTNLPFAVEYLAEILSTMKGNTLPPPIFHNICKIYNLDRSVMETLAKQLRFRVPWKAVEAWPNRETNISSQLNELLKIVREKRTESSDKYKCTRNDDGTYQFPPTNAKLLAITDKYEVLSIVNPRKVVSEELNSKIDAEVEISNKQIRFVFDKTNFIATRNETDSDTGDVFIFSQNDSIHFKAKNAVILQDFIIHSVSIHDNRFVGKKIKAGANAVLYVHADRRLNLMRNYLTTHLMKMSLTDIFPVFYFKVYISMENYIRFTIRVLGREISIKDKATLEEKLKDFISQKLTVRETIMSSGRKLLNLPHLHILPSQYYPSCNLRVITIVDDNGSILSNEPCDAVHLSEVADVKDFKITKWKIRPSLDLELEIVTGDKVRITSEVEEILKNDVKKFENISALLLNNDSTATLTEVIDGHEELRMYVFKTLHMLSQKKVSSNYIHDSMTTLKMFLLKHRKKLNNVPRELVVKEITSRIYQKINVPKMSIYFCLLHYKWFRHRSFKVDVTYTCDFPIFIFHCDDECIHGMSYVPETCILRNFNAEILMRFVAEKHKLQIEEEEDLKKYCFARIKCPEHRVYKYVDAISITAQQAAQMYMK